jgi:hypothetical protein
VFYSSPTDDTKQAAAGGITFEGKVQLVAFLVFEVCVGVFWPSIMSVRARALARTALCVVSRMEGVEGRESSRRGRSDNNAKRHDASTQPGTSSCCNFSTAPAPAPGVYPIRVLAAGSRLTATRSLAVSVSL